MTAAWHFFHILQILHSRLKKTFVDLKFENLWWVENERADNAQLKVTDFGTLAEIKTEEEDRGVTHDLLLGAIIAFYLLTGYAIRYSIRGLKESFKPFMNRYQDEVSWGTQQVLRKALHRNPRRRYQSAKKVVAELRMLSDFWKRTDDDLYQLVYRNLNEAYEQDDLASGAAKKTRLPGENGVGNSEEKKRELRTL